MLIINQCGHYFLNVEGFYVMPALLPFEIYILMFIVN